MTTAPLTGRRAALLDAAVEVLGTGGMRALTHRAVDAAAGVPEGTTSGYYRTRAALLAALEGHVATQLSSSIDRLRLDLATLPTQLSARERETVVAERVAAYLNGHLERPGLVQAQAELSLESARNPELSALIGGWREEFTRIVTDIAMPIRPEAAAARASTTVAAFQGVLLAALVRPPADRAAWVTEATRQLVHALAAE